MNQAIFSCVIDETGRSWESADAALSAIVCYDTIITWRSTGIGEFVLMLKIVKGCELGE